jgi:large subunit ribosomal protein L10
MVQQKKIFIVQELTQKINDAKALYLTDYRGLNVAQITDLRKAVKEVGGELEVIKNRLFKLALKASEKKPDEELNLIGPTAILWANEDEISPLKVLSKFAQETDLLEIKIGFLGKEQLTKEKTEQLSLIPPRNELEAQLTSYLFAPIYGLINSLNWNLQKLVLTIKGIALNS